MAVDANAIGSIINVRNCADVTVKADVYKTTAVPYNLSIYRHTPIQFVRYDLKYTCQLRIYFV